MIKYFRNKSLYVCVPKHYLFALITRTIICKMRENLHLRICAQALYKFEMQNIDV